MPDPVQKHYGGNFAPPLTPELLDQYESLLPYYTDERVREVVADLLLCARTFQETPDSTLPASSRHTTGLADVVPLEQEEIKRIWDVVPWGYEIDAYRKLFNEALPDGNPKQIPDLRAPKGYRTEFQDPQGAALQTAARHLLWYAKELELDREPITTDKL